MTKNSATDDLSFFRGAMAHISGSLDLQDSLVETFRYLKRHFPIEGISLHRYSEELNCLELLFLVHDDRFDFVETVVPLTEEEGVMMTLRSKNIGSILNVPRVEKDSVASRHGQALAPLLPYKKRAYLVGIMRYEEEKNGHLCFMGTHEECFTKEHERRMALLFTPFALTMNNLLQYQRTMEFQKSLHAEKEALEKTVELLQGNTIIGAQSGLKGTMDVVQQLRGREIPALILGETGTGKELVADFIQSISPRSTKPFIKVNCGAIPDTLVDSELFGYEKGAFTGATSSKPGKFEQAHGGTLFLDEIGELPLQAQVRLLRVLQNNVVERLGSTKSISVDVRIIAATNRNLELMLQEGAFREDLYYRLYVFPIHVPPLRERTQDIPALIYHFIREACRKLDIAVPPQMPPKTLERLLQYSWPGNVRELENLVNRGVTLYPQGPLVLDELLPQDEGWYIAPEESQSYFEKTIDARVEAVLEARLGKLSLPRPAPPQAAPAEEAQSHPPVKTWENAMREAIEAALAASHGKIHGAGGAAELLALNPNTLRSKMRKLGISAKRK